MIPDADACKQLWQEAGLSQDVIDHEEAVHALAKVLAGHAGNLADPSVVQAGALLHDIGRASTHDRDHVPRGVAFLEDQGVDEQVVSCVACHMGAGITEQEAKMWGWPTDRRYMPTSVEEKIVCHADTLTFGTNHGDLRDAIAKFEQQGLDLVSRRAQALHADLEATLGIDIEPVVAGLTSGEG